MGPKSPHPPPAPLRGQAQRKKTGLPLAIGSPVLLYTDTAGGGRSGAEFKNGLDGNVCVITGKSIFAMAPHFRVEDAQRTSFAAPILRKECPQKTV